MVLINTANYNGMLTNVSYKVNAPLTFTVLVTLRSEGQLQEGVSAWGTRSLCTALGTWKGWGCWKGRGDEPQHCNQGELRTTWPGSQGRSPPRVPVSWSPSSSHQSPPPLPTISTARGPERRQDAPEPAGHGRWQCSPTSQGSPAGPSCSEPSRTAAPRPAGFLSPRLPLR